jgi:hypothetical protein
LELTSPLCDGVLATLPTLAVVWTAVLLLAVSGFRALAAEKRVQALEAQLRNLEAGLRGREVPLHQVI